MVALRRDDEGNMSLDVKLIAAVLAILAPLCVIFGGFAVTYWKVDRIEKSIDSHILPKIEVFDMFIAKQEAADEFRREAKKQ